MTHSYFVVMQNFGERIGFEANVNPEQTRRQIIQNIRDGQYEHIVFIHRIEDGCVEDVTDELVSAAEMEAA